MTGRPWIRAYTELLTHPKFIELNNDQQACLWRLWLYAGLHETDGVITRKSAKVCSVPPRILSKLATSGWLETDHESFVIHDWTEHQPDSETVHHKRILAAKRAKAYRKRHARVTRDVTHDVTAPSRGQKEKEKESPYGLSPSPTPSNERHAGAAPAASALAGPKPPAPEVEVNGDGPPLKENGRVDLEAIAEDAPPAIRAAIQRARARVLVEDDE